MTVSTMGAICWYASTTPVSVFTPEGEEISNIPYLFSCQLESFVVSEAFKRESFFSVWTLFSEDYSLFSKILKRGKPLFFSFLLWSNLPVSSMSLASWRNPGKWFSSFIFSNCWGRLFTWSKSLVLNWKLFWHLRDKFNTTRHKTKRLPR